MNSRSPPSHALDRPPLETLLGELRIQLHLASLDAKQLWDRDLEPRLRDARAHAREAGEASRSAILDVVAAFRAFAANR